MAFPSTPVDGQTSIINGIAYTYASSTNSWSRTQTPMPVLSITVDRYISNGSTLSYTLSTTPATKELVSVNIDGILQQSTAYTIAGNIITLTGTPVTGSIIEVKTTNATPASVVTGLVFDSFTGNGVTTSFNLNATPVSKNYTLVTIGGVTQQKSTYSVSGTTLTFDTAPPNISSIEVITFGPAITSTQAAGSNAQIQFNSSNILAGSANLTFDSTTNTLSTGNITLNSATATGNITASYFIGNGSQLTSVPTAGTVTTNAQPNITSVGTLTSLTVTGTTTLQLATDVLATIAGATGVVAHDLTTSGVFNHTTPAANFTANFTNVPVTNNRVLATTLLINQGATPYLPTAVQIEGAAQTIKWVTGSAPTGNANKVDVVSFSLVRASNSWTVMGQGTYYG